MIDCYSNYTLNQEARPNATLIAPEKRKRGRPQKDPSERRAQKARSQAARMPPGFVQLTNNAPRVDPINDPTETMVGQIVTGVVEATFDAGYLLAVRIGNSKITLRGAVFKPGHTAPVTPENDVAPHVQMIKRTELPFPAELQPKCRRKRRSKEKNMQLVTYVGNCKPIKRFLPLAVYPPNGPTSQPSESQTSSQFVVPPSVSGNNNPPFKHAEGGKSLKSNDMQDPVVKTESDVGDMNEPLFVEPLQTRHLVHHFQPPSVLGGVMHVGTGRMTELLQVFVPVATKLIT
ncbi:hypothetical protein L1987_78210 [Smallanthus sonchifolius]|uniref:Uncharacterized protein n=1 Tax=Smallanthus sonchifolius TaxID=185202 RepID=A0ACB8ZC85_9ASTR|nr:hypothetical protein L1987_78210 [Smallanthus sonchifolius]